MRDNIKAGDLVVIVKPTTCCRDVKHIGMVFRVGRVQGGLTRCECGWLGERIDAEVENIGRWAEIAICMKIDPPAEDDSLPTRANADKEVTA